MMHAPDRAERLRANLVKARRITCDWCKRDNMVNVMGGVCRSCWAQIQREPIPLPLDMGGVSRGQAGHQLAVDELIQRSHRGYGFCVTEAWE